MGHKGNFGYLGGFPVYNLYPHGTLLKHQKRKKKYAVEPISVKGKSQFIQRPQTLVNVLPQNQVNKEPRDH